jgi:hypothetical protein
VDESRVLGNGQREEMRLARAGGGDATGIVTSDDHRRVERGAGIDKTPAADGGNEYFAKRGVADRVDHSLHEQGTEAAVVTVGAGESAAELVRVIPGAMHHRRAGHKAVLVFRDDLEVVRIGEEVGDVVDALKWKAVRSDEMSEGDERASVCRTRAANDQPGRSASSSRRSGGAHDEGESGDPVRRAPGTWRLSARPQRA